MTFNVQKCHFDTQIFKTSSTVGGVAPSPVEKSWLRHALLEDCHACRNSLISFPCFPALISFSFFQCRIFSLFFFLFQIYFSLLFSSFLSLIYSAFSFSFSNFICFVLLYLPSYFLSYFFLSFPFFSFSNSYFLL